MKRTLWIFLVPLLALSLLAFGCGEQAPAPQQPTAPSSQPSTTPAPQPEAPKPPEKETIIVTDLNWDSATYTGRIIALIVEHGYDYPVEVVSGSSIAMFQGIMDDRVDIYPEIWLPNQQQAWDKGMEEESFLPVTITNNDNWQCLFTVPTYVIKGDPARNIAPMAPDLKSVQDLFRPEIIEVFKDPEDPGKGRIYTCVPGWECEKINLKQIDALGLDEYYNAFPPGSEAALWASLKGAYDKGEPWIGKVWSPTWIAGMLDLTRLEEEPFSKEGFENGLTAWPACDLWIVANNELPNKAPDLFPFLLRIRLTSAELDVGLANMRDYEIDPPEGAVWFLKNRQELWSQWVTDEVEAKILAKLPSL